jgi:predicted phosphodiesterase
MTSRARIAVITDVHANLPALDAALAAIARAGCDAIYHTGDAIGIGPYPAECLDRLLSTPNMHFLMGNHDELFAHGLPVPRPEWMSEGEEQHQRWTHAQLDPALRAVVAGWPWAIRAEFGSLTVSFQHYALDAEGQGLGLFIPRPDAAAFDRAFPDDGTALFFYGHDHQASNLRGRACYINPGALGCSSSPLARFAMLEVGDDGEYTVRQEATPYDEAPLLRAFAEREVPERDFILRAFFGKANEGANRA